MYVSEWSNIVTFIILCPGRTHCMVVYLHCIDIPLSWTALYIGIPGPPVDHLLFPRPDPIANSWQGDGWPPIPTSYPITYISKYIRFRYLRYNGLPPIPTSYPLHFKILNILKYWWMATNTHKLPHNLAAFLNIDLHIQYICFRLFLCRWASVGALELEALINNLYLTQCFS